MKTLEEIAGETIDQLFRMSIVTTTEKDGTKSHYPRVPGKNDVYILFLSALQEATAPLISQITDLEVKNQAFRDVLDGDAQMIAGLNRSIAELEEKLADWENAQKMALDEKCSGDQEHCGCVVPLKMRIAELEKALCVAIAAIESLPDDSLGVREPRHEGDTGWYIKDELLNGLRAAAQAIKEGDDGN